MLTENQIHALHTRNLINHATWCNALYSLRNDDGHFASLSAHALQTCALAVEQLVESAVNAACKVIQDRLGATTGDLAATVLSGGAIEGLLTAYVLAELEEAAVSRGVAEARP